MTTASDRPSQPFDADEHSHPSVRASSSPTGQSGEYALRRADRWEGQGEVTTSRPPPPESFRKPFASLIPMDDRGGSMPGSPRRPLQAGPPRRLGTCSRHKVALSPTGECVLCRREAPTRVSGRLVALLVVLALSAGALLAAL